MNQVIELSKSLTFVADCIFLNLIAFVFRSGTVEPTHQHT
jgi:hypothetical protein